MEQFQVDPSMDGEDNIMLMRRVWHGSAHVADAVPHAVEQDEEREDY